MAPSELLLTSDLRLLNRGHETRWGNLGLWQATDEPYPVACARLAQRLGEAAELGPGQRVLDVAHGAGDQLALWVERFDVERVEGRELLASNVRRARRLLARAGLVGRVTVRQGSATELSEIPVGSQDRTLALDAAYHFAPRRAFFDCSARALAPGGRLALTDVVLDARAPRWVNRLASLAGIPSGNLLAWPAYVAELEAAGFCSVTRVDLEQEVLGGFARFTARHWRRHFYRWPFAGWPKLLLTAWGCRLALARGWLRYALITAERS